MDSGSRCNACRRRPKQPGRGKCAACQREYKREWARKKLGCKPRQAPAPLGVSKICTTCHKPYPNTRKYFTPHGKWLSAECKPCHNEYVAKKSRELRVEVLSHYSNGSPKCACCGEWQFEFLALDHVNGGGNKHKKEIGKSLFRWLKSKGFPPGFRVLCHNCNQARGFYGFCPHESTLKAVG